MLRLFKWLFLLVLLIVGVIVAIVFSKDTLAKAAVEQQIRAQTGMDVKIEKFSLRLLSPLATIENVTLYNPADFGGVPLMSIREMHVQFDREALAHRELRLRLLKMNIAELAVVRNDLGQTNIFAFAATPKSGTNAEMVDFKGIDVANISLSRVVYVDLKNQQSNRVFNVNVQNLAFRDLKTSAEFYRTFVDIWEQRVRR